MTFTHGLATNNYGTAKFIVSASAAEGTHTTIASALTDASSGDTIFIRPGTYTENLTLKVGVNLAAYDCDALNGNVTISGTCTLTAAGTVDISGIRLQTNSAALVAVTGIAASILNLKNCYLNCTNNTGITFSSSSASSQINIIDSKGDLGTTGIGLFAHSSAGTLLFTNGFFTNSGSSLTASTASAGSLQFYYTYFFNPITTSGTNTQNSSNSKIDTSFLNVTCFTCGGSGNGGSDADSFASGTASAISVGSTLLCEHLVITSSNANAITGGGTLNYGTIDFNGTSKTINTTTQTAINGTTFTPTITFGGAAVGVTYGTQYGKYIRTGNMCSFVINLVLTSKGSSAGAVAINGLPFVSENDGATYNFMCAVINATTTGTYFWAELVANSASIAPAFGVATTGAASGFADTNTANNSQFRIQGLYFI